eukprot:scaffold415225_cov41-Prasinocladus_malaysianus.AAC.1
MQCADGQLLQLDTSPCLCVWPLVVSLNIKVSEVTGPWTVTRTHELLRAVAAAMDIEASSSRMLVEQLVSLPNMPAGSARFMCTILIVPYPGTSWSAEDVDAVYGQLNGT